MDEVPVPPLPAGDVVAADLVPSAGDDDERSPEGHEQLAQGGGMCAHEGIHRPQHGVRPVGAVELSAQLVGAGRQLYACRLFGR